MEYYSKSRQFCLVLLMGSSSNSANILLIGRQKSSRRSKQIEKLIGQLHDLGFSVWRYASRGGNEDRTKSSFQNLKATCKQKIEQAIYAKYSSYPGWLDYLSPSRSDTMMWATELKKTLGQCEKGKTFIILSHSRGGRIGTYTDNLPIIKGHICFGYPFLNPEDGFGLSRVRHLKTIKTPTLIIQGRQDIYGGEEVAQLYRFSQGTSLHFVDSEHDYSCVSDEDSAEISKKVFSFLNTLGMPLPNACQSKLELSA
ncbi:alpha/beta family hydrolase [Pseudovibrio sp. Tun.PSC04-5.I4]|uniref:alpha/beta family hydrolase n=1 Tax=Pseudovibrio sp. Tun.PSC04-5.I4 TaxID=1798213 RepID=UPI00087FFC26|nr:alpha/beta family hydrolase [Pseudovibrio sp. Tun.PSC04-5.I4]SDQ85585.1 hypothetical protein SAMN04515695_1661 [Pseudovibrio sp. Tun.PSC04-5.I4]